MVIRAIVADDQAVVRTAFANLLATQKDIEVVGEASDGDEAVRIAAQQRPDIALLDIRMPKMDGLDATREILALPRQETKVLILTTFDLDEYVYAALSAGASGFLLKDTTFPELLQAVRVIAQGNALLAPEITKRLIATFAQQRPTTPGDHILAELTSREAEVLTLIAYGLSNAEISDRLMITPHTVKTHINRLFAKRNLRDRAQAVILAYEQGLVTPANQD